MKYLATLMVLGLLAVQPAQAEVPHKDKVWLLSNNLVCNNPNSLPIVFKDTKSRDTLNARILYAQNISINGRIPCDFVEQSREPFVTDGAKSLGVLEEENGDEIEIWSIHGHYYNNPTDERWVLWLELGQPI